MTYDSNQKHPKIELVGKYPNIWIDQYPDGHQVIRSLQPGNESSFTVEPSGNYSGHGPDGQMVSVTVDKQHEYTGDGKSSTIDGHSDQKVGGSSRTNTDGGTSTETAGSSFSGCGGMAITATKDSKVDASTSGDHFGSTEGNITTDHSGNMHHNITGDVIDNIVGNKVTIVSGDLAINNQGGSVDIKVDAGKYRVKAADEIIIDSDTKITLRVGGSKITITPDMIEQIAAAIKLIKG